MSEILPCEFDAVIPPSSLLVFWPGDEPPTAEEIRCRLADWGQPAPESDDLTPEETLWSFWFDLADRPSSYFFWCEALAGSRLIHFENVPWRSGDQEATARKCRWVVGLEGPISIRQPAADYQLQLRLCDAVSRGWAPAVYDAGALHFWTIEDLGHLIEVQTPPRTSCLYSLHKLLSDRSGSGEPLYWLHTHGMERAGVPDLEIFEVPERLLPPARELIETVADLWIEFETPDPQVSFDVGRDLEIYWRPWQAVVLEMPKNAIGGRNFRHAKHGHAGYRAVLVGDWKGGWFSRRWYPPTAVLRQLNNSKTTLFKTMAESRRMASLARERWGTFGLLFVGKHPDDWRFAVKLSFSIPEKTRSSEHLWFEVQDLHPDNIQATLLSEPCSPQGVPFLETDWHDLKRLSDWRIITSRGTFGPENAKILLEEGVMV